MLAVLLLLQTTMPGPAVAARVEALLPRSPIPREGEVAVLTTSSDDTVWLGDQLEILTTAWFPVSIRQRLRRPPTLRPPTLNGVYGYPVVTLPGAAAQQIIGETEYDLFASHQVVFPLTSGRLTIPAAELSFSLPGGRPLFGEDRLDERRSPLRTVTVRALPLAGQPEGFAGAVARDLRVTWRLSAPNSRVGELFAADLLVGGQGNLTLWATPEIAWPQGVRVYPDRVDEAPDWRDGRLGGVRRTRFLLLADSTGSITLPAVRFPYFDPQVGRYREVTASAVVVPVLPAIAPDSPRNAPAWVVERPAGFASRVVGNWWGMLLTLAALTPLAAWWYARTRRRRRLTGVPRRVSTEERFEHLMARLGGEPAASDPRLLSGALRRAGVSRTDAEAAVTLHERLRRQRFAPGLGQDVSDGGLSRDTEGWLKRLPARIVGRHAGLIWLAMVLGASDVMAQSLDPRQLYRDGAWEAAVTAQQPLVRSSPSSASAWRNYAAALWMARRDGEAAAALLEAYRLAPRDRGIRQLWSEVALSHQQLRPLAPLLPVTPPELILAGFLLWLVAGGLLAAGARRWAAGAAIGALVVAGAGLSVDRVRSRPSALTAHAVPLRLSPHGLAPTLGMVDGLALVPLEDAQPGWVRIVDPLGRRGWVPSSAVAPLRRLD
ncbi:MAG: hypothetical protein ABR551_00710 [Gemmatimonadales bacterium]